jgi:hypothetical protein
VNESEANAELNRKWITGLRRLIAAAKAHRSLYESVMADAVEIDPILTPNQKVPQEPATEY